MNRAATVAFAPLSGIYSLIVRSRNALYRRRVFPTHDVGAPVISVGNLTAGGTGKTPLVEWIARDLASRGRTVCVLTRGYGRQNPRQRIITSNGNEVLADVTQAGDEAFMLAEKLRRTAAVICDADRISAARWAIENLGSNIFVLDDAFQHQRIKRNLNILAIDATNPWGSGKLLPAGSLREPISELSRANCIVITRADQSENLNALRDQIEKVRAGLPVFVSRIKQLQLRALGVTDSVEPVTIKAAPIAAFCGIGNPESFFFLLRHEGYPLGHTETFRDHHVYSQSDIDRVCRESISSGAQTLLTTAKDEVKLRSLKFALPCAAIDIEIEFDKEDQLSALLEEAARIKPGT